MIYFIYLFGLTIIGGLLFIIPLIKFALKGMLYQSPYKNNIFSNMVVERAYRAIDLKASIDYTDAALAYKYPNYGGKFNQVIFDPKQKEYLLDKECHKLARKMLQEGLIEVRDIGYEDRPYDLYPYARRIEMKVKVYKPETDVAIN